MVTDANGKKVAFKAERPSNFKTQQEAEKFLEEVVGAEFSVSSIEKKPGKRSPAAPFTTSTLQQEASRKLSFPVAITILCLSFGVSILSFKYLETPILKLKSRFY